jgi:hypothetical protein
MIHHLHHATIKTPRQHRRQHDSTFTSHHGQNSSAMPSQNTSAAPLPT